VSIRKLKAVHALTHPADKAGTKNGGGVAHVEDRVAPAEAVHDLMAVLGLIRFLGHLERGGYDGSSDGEWSEAGRWERAEGAASAA